MRWRVIYLFHFLASGLPFQTDVGYCSQRRYRGEGQQSLRERCFL
jgi:hypothetical protein